MRGLWSFRQEKSIIRPPSRNLSYSRQNLQDPAYYYRNAEFGAGAGGAIIASYDVGISRQTKFFFRARFRE